jgi:hypothetical protein
LFVGLIIQYIHEKNILKECSVILVSPSRCMLDCISHLHMSEMILLASSYTNDNWYCFQIQNPKALYFKHNNILL